MPGVYRVRSGPEFCVRLSGFVRRGFHTHHLFNVESPKAVILAVIAAFVTRVWGGTYSIGFIGGPRQRLLDHAVVPWSALFRQALRTAHFVVCNNPEVADALVRVGAPRPLVHPIPAFHAKQTADVGVPDAATLRFSAACDPVLCAIVHPRFETEHPHHEMELLLAAVRVVADRFPDIGCVVIGGAEYVSTYARMALAAGLERRFHFTGEVAHRDCLGVMAASTVFVRAYLKDGTSSSVREALALGTPAVVSRNSQHPKAARQFSPNNPLDLAAQLLATLEDLATIRQQLAADSNLQKAGGLERELALFPRMPERLGMDSG